MDANGLAEWANSGPIGPVVAPNEVIDLLLVEDDGGDAFLVEEFLDASGLIARVRWARSLSDALVRLQPPPDCVLLDLDLPDGEGLEGLQRILAVAPGAAVLVLTGLADVDVGAAAVAAGAQDYLIKGQVDSQTLARAIRYAVQRSQIAQAAQALRESELRAEENTRLERGLLPTPMVTDPNLRVVSRYRSGRQRALLGGDFYDVVQGQDGTLNVIIGDVSGHGPDEAALGVRLRIAWRALVLAGIEGSRLLQLLEQVLLAERASEEIFATVCQLTLSADGRRVKVVCAGHPPPLLLTGSRARPVPVVPTPPVGIQPGRWGWSGEESDRPTGASLLFYTDGLIEGRVGSGPERLGIEGLTAIITELAEFGDPEDLLDAVITAAEEADHGHSEDDIAVLHLSWGGR